LGKIGILDHMLV